jgi:lipoyl(octanoyl) transferase
LRESRLSVHQYIWNLEEVIIKTLRSIHIAGQRIQKHPGVWVGDEKICALGLRIIKDVSMHGFALNVNLDLQLFDYINPCGIIDKEVTSISKLLGYQVEIKGIEEHLLRAFSEVFNFELEEGKEAEKCLAIINSLSGSG